MKYNNNGDDTPVKQKNPAKKRKVSKKRLVYPTCINRGCKSKVAVSKNYKNGMPKYRAVCDHCHKVSYGAERRYKPGVSAMKKTYCENHDGHLGFDCFCSPGGLRTDLPSHTLDIDHKDGNHNNNAEDNIQTLDKMCHAQKTKINGDTGKKNIYVWAEDSSTLFENFDMSGIDR